MGFLQGYSLVAVGAPHHHGVGVLGLAGGDGSGRHDGGDSSDAGHFDKLCEVVGESVESVQEWLAPGNRAGISTATSRAGVGPGGDPNLPSYGTAVTS